MRAYERLIRYVQVHTASSEDTEKTPTTERQFDLSRLLAKEMEGLGFEGVRVDGNAYVYGFLQARHADILPQIAAWKTPDYAAVENCCAGLHSVESRDVLPTCTAAGQTGRVCGVCGQVLEPITPIPATGHADGDGDEVCDRCGAYLGEVPSLLQRLLAFFRRLAEFWRNLFRFGR